jgi:hypothetical protein
MACSPVPLARTTATDEARLAEQRPASQVNRQPVLEDRFEERRQRHVPCGSLFAVPFLLADEDLVGIEIDVMDFHSQQFAPPGAGVGGGADEGVDPRLGGVHLDRLQEFVDLRLAEVEAIPQVGLFRIGKAVTGNSPF